MTTSRSTGRGGNAALNWILLLVGASGAFLTVVLTQVDRQNVSARKDVFESSILATTHAMAALLKQEILNNYEAYRANTGGWNLCPHGPPSATEFLALLADPPDPCRPIPFRLTYFKTDEDPARAELPLSRLQQETLLPLEELNRTRARVQITGFNTDPSRNQIIIDITAGLASARALATDKKVRAIVDLSRTVQPPKGDASCRLCHAVPGSVCCSGAVDFAYLERGTGRVMDASYDRSTKELSVTPRKGDVPDPRVVSVKYAGNARLNYYQDSFCIGTFGGCPANRTLYVIDGAVANGQTFYLTVDGRVLRESSGTPVLTDPKLESIAHDGKNWLLLRSDGAILKAESLSDPNGIEEVEGLRVPVAERLAVGPGPAPLP